LRGDSDPVAGGVSLFIINPAASEMLPGFLLRKSWGFRSGDVCLRLWMRFSKLELDDSKTACDMEDSMSAAKSGILCGRDMSVQGGDSDLEE
jgi:hypothetical protein